MAVAVSRLVRILFFLFSLTVANSSGDSECTKEKAAQRRYEKQVNKKNLKFIIRQMVGWPVRDSSVPHEIIDQVRKYDGESKHPRNSAERPNV